MKLTPLYNTLVDNSWIRCIKSKTKNTLQLQTNFELSNLTSNNN